MPQMRVMIGVNGGPVPLWLEEAFGSLDMGERFRAGAGDTNIMWSRLSDDEKKAAQETFDRLTKAGYIAYSVEKGGGKGEVVKKFDPAAEKLILAPPMAGGGA